MARSDHVKPMRRGVIGVLFVVALAALWTPPASADLVLGVTTGDCADCAQKSLDPGQVMLREAGGNWEYTISCSGCGSGRSNPLAGPRQWDAVSAGLTATSVTSTSKSLYFDPQIIGRDDPADR